MRTFILSGSHRANSETERVCTHLQCVLRRRGHDAPLYSLAGNPLPLWSETATDAPPVKEEWERVSAELRQCDALIVATPEWSGTTTPGFKNFFLYVNDEVRHKPALIVVTSSGNNGAYPVAEIRATLTKNNQLCFIPEHLIVRNVADMFVKASSRPEDDRRLRDRVEYALNMLDSYAGALVHAREDERLLAPRFAYGM